MYKKEFFKNHETRMDEFNSIIGRIANNNELDEIEIGQTTEFDKNRHDKIMSELEEIGSGLDALLASMQ